MKDNLHAAQALLDYAIKDGFDVATCRVLKGEVVRLSQEIERRYPDALRDEHHPTK